MEYNKKMYEKKLIELTERLFLILDELISVYPYYKTYDDSKYKEQYENDISNLEKTKNDFFILKNDIQKKIQYLEKTIRQNNLKINEYKIDNAMLSEKNISLIDSKNGAKGLFEDSEHLYKINIIKNWLLLAIVSSFIIYNNYQLN